MPLANPEHLFRRGYRPKVHEKRDSQSIAADIAAFVAAGGSIKKCRLGESGLKPKEGQ